MALAALACGCHRAFAVAVPCLGHASPKCLCGPLPELLYISARMSPNLETLMTDFYKVAPLPHTLSWPSLTPTLLYFFPLAYYTCWLFPIECKLHEGHDFDMFTPLCTATEPVG